MTDDFHVIELPAAARIPFPATDVAHRLSIYNPDGGFARDLAFVWDKAGEIIVATVADYCAGLATSGTPFGTVIAESNLPADHLGSRIGAHMRAQFVTPVNEHWIALNGRIGREIFASGISPAVVMDGIMGRTATICGALRRAFTDSPD
ncbi:hypothetical protein, partial [uncultured Sphingomonas sp.]|uniref:hypothetical protein n=1 Tax=uncultured Sphingomonas sp. TaxID=158754 RepID=UPI0025F5342F